MKFAERLRELRKERGLTQQKVSNILNYGCTAITNYEGGRNEPSLSDLIRLAKFFDVTVDYLIGASDDRFCVRYERIDCPVHLFIEFYKTSSSHVSKSMDEVLLGIIRLCRYTK